MGLYLCAATLNQAALAQGQARRAAVCWIAARPASWSGQPAAGARRGSAASRSASRSPPALLCALLYLIYRNPRPRRRGHARARLAARSSRHGWRPPTRRLRPAPATRRRPRGDPPVSSGRVRVAEDRRAGDEKRRPRLRDADDASRRRSRRRPRLPAPPATSPSRRTLSADVGMNDCPPQPGLTVMHRTMVGGLRQLARPPRPGCRD